MSLFPSDGEYFDILEFDVTAMDGHDIGRKNWQKSDWWE